MTISEEEIKKIKLEEAKHNKKYFIAKLNEYEIKEDITNEEIYKIAYYSGMIASINQFLEKEENQEVRKEEKCQQA